ncbi:hypothetical protein [Streptomyces sp. NPDC059909]|uniref:hypothetical protein n=1 Tax=Streptomyces sp. NPDC059909 TaxID=3346998 RepID=UPI00365264A9
MISEPELVGGADFPAPEAPASVVLAGGGDDAPKPPRPPRPWLWALGGAVLASAVWAGGLYAYERIGPDLGGYRVNRDLCKEAEFKALTAAVGTRTDGFSAADDHRSLNRSTCVVDFLPPGGREFEGLQYAVEVSYQLHKETDPEPEFDAEARPSPEFGDERKAKRIEGIGERAYLLMPDTGDGNLDLVVLDGRAVLKISVFVQLNYGPEDEPVEKPPAGTDVPALKGAVIEDMKALIARLKRPA